MKQTELGLDLSTKRMRKREFLAQMERVVPWAELVALVAPYAPEGRNDRPPFSVLTMLRIHFMQQWFTLSDPAMEEALHDVPTFWEFAGLTLGQRLSDESTILRFRHCLEDKKLADQILVAVNELLQRKGSFLKTGERDPEMHQTKKGNQWYFGMKAHIGVDAHSGLVHTIRGTAANVSDVVEGNSLLHGQETDVFGDAGYQGADKQPDAPKGKAWHVAMRPGKRRALDKDRLVDQLADQVEKIKASIRAKAEHPFRVVKQQFGHVKVRYRGLAKNTAQLKTLFALANLWMARRKLLVLDAVLRPKAVGGV